MAHNARIRTFGFWTDTTPVTAAEYEAFDQAQFEAINGDLGGTWAPSAPIIIGGSGIQAARLDGSWESDGTPTAVGWAGGNFTSTLSTGHAFSVAKSFARALPASALVDGWKGGGRWEVWGTRATQEYVTSAPSAFVRLPIPPDGTLQSVRLHLRALGTRSVLPVTLPACQVQKLTVDTGVLTTVSLTVVDPSATLDEYAVVHEVEIVPAGGIVVSTGDVLFLQLWGEAGADAVVSGLTVYGVTYTYTMTYLTNM